MVDVTVTSFSKGGSTNTDFGRNEHERTKNLKEGGEEVKRPRQGCNGMVATSEMGRTERGWKLL